MCVGGSDRSKGHFGGHFINRKKDIRKKRNVSKSKADQKSDKLIQTKTDKRDEEKRRQIESCLSDGAQEQNTTSRRSWYWTQTKLSDRRIQQEWRLEWFGQTDGQRDRHTDKALE